MNRVDRVSRTGRGRDKTFSNIRVHPRQTVAPRQHSLALTLVVVVSRAPRAGHPTTSLVPPGEYPPLITPAVIATRLYSATSAMAEHQRASAVIKKLYAVIRPLQTPRSPRRPDSVVTRAIVYDPAPGGSGWAFHRRRNAPKSTSRPRLSLGGHLATPSTGGQTPTTQSSHGPGIGCSSGLRSCMRVRRETTWIAR